MVEGPRRQLRAGDYVSIRPRHVLTHDNTAPALRKFVSLGATRIQDPRQPVFALDHDIQNRSETNLAKYRAIEAFAREQGVDFYPAGTGIGHQVMVEQGYVTPGSFVVASDSHANMYGALGAIGTPVVRTDAAAIWATGEFWWQVPRTVQVVLDGTLPAGSTGKDIIIALCGLYNNGEVLNAAVEFTGPGVAGLSMDERLSIANMSTEWGALVGWFPVDAMTLAYLRACRQRVGDAQGSSASARGGSGGVGGAAPRYPTPTPLYAARITLNLARRDAARLRSGYGAGHASLVAEIEDRRVPIQKAYLVSCVNARLEDLEAAARVVAGKHVAPTCSSTWRRPASAVQEEAERRGAWQTLLDAGAITAAGRLRALHRPGRGGAGARRGGYLRHQPQFQGPHGLSRRAVLPGQSRRGGGIGHRRLHQRRRTRSRTARQRATIQRWQRRPTARKRVRDPARASPKRVQRAAGLPAAG